jgi:hypothetical protein
MLSLSVKKPVEYLGQHEQPSFLFLSTKGGVEKEAIELSSYSDLINPSKIAILIYLGQQ